MKTYNAGHGYDELGLSPEAIEKVRPALRFLHERYFRVESSGLENLPKSGGFILVANHSGTVPIDGAMIVADVLLRADRLVRPIADRFLPLLPFFGTWLARLGAAVGSRRNVELLLSRDEPILIFPEGTTGISKPWSSRYRLQAWRVGHAELAIRYRVPIIPVAVIGAEEQMPQIGRLLMKPLGAPYIPVPATPIPLPVKYRLFYGEPIDMSEHDADDTRSIREAAEKTHERLELLMQDGLRRRKGIFA